MSEHAKVPESARLTAEEKDRCVELAEAWVAIANGRSFSDATTPLNDAITLARGFLDLHESYHAVKEELEVAWNDAHREHQRRENAEAERDAASAKGYAAGADRKSTRRTS